MGNAMAEAKSTPATGFLLDGAWGYELKPLGKWSSVSSNIGKKHWEKVKEKLLNKLLEFSKLCENNGRSLYSTYFH